MTKELNWREQMHWELYKQYLKNGSKELQERKSRGLAL